MANGVWKGFHPPLGYSELWTTFVNNFVDLSNPSMRKICEGQNGKKRRKQVGLSRATLESQVKDFILILAHSQVQVTWPVPTSPVPSWAVPTWPVPSWPISTRPVLTKPVLTWPVLTLPVLTWPALTWHVRTWPVRTWPVRIWPILTSQILTYQITIQTSHRTPPDTIQAPSRHH